MINILTGAAHRFVRFGLGREYQPKILDIAADIVAGLADAGRNCREESIFVAGDLEELGHILHLRLEGSRHHSMHLRFTMEQDR